MFDRWYMQVLREKLERPFVHILFGACNHRAPRARDNRLHRLPLPCPAAHRRQSAGTPLAVPVKKRVPRRWPCRTTWPPRRPAPPRPRKPRGFAGFADGCAAVLPGWAFRDGRAGSTGFAGLVEVPGNLGRPSRGLTVLPVPLPGATRTAPNDSKAWA